MIPEDPGQWGRRPLGEQNDEPSTELPPDERTAEQARSDVPASSLLGITAETRGQEVPPLERWEIGLGLGLAVLGGLSWIFFGFGIVNGNLLVIVLAAVPALSCLAAGWLLRSWWGLIASALVYIAISAPLWFRLQIGSPQTSADFVLYVVLPAAVMSLIGTAIGRSRARQAQRRPPHRYGAL